MNQLSITLILVVGGSVVAVSDALSNMKPSVYCHPQYMTACFPKNPDFKVNPATVQNPECYQFTSNSTASCVTASLQYGQCGVSSNHNASHVTYSSSLYISQDFGDPIIRNDTLTANIVCIYPLDMISTLNLALNPFVQNIVVNSTDIGRFQLSMALYQYSNYTGPYQHPGSNVLKLPAKTPLYFGLFTDVVDTRFVLVMKNCYATPSGDPDDPLTYNIIQNNCPNTRDLTISVEENGVSMTGKFQIQMFKFRDDQYVYFHCAVRLCSNTTETCKPSCGGRSAGRAPVNEITQMLTLGPFKSSAGGLRSSWAPLLAALALIMSTIKQHL